MTRIFNSALLCLALLVLAGCGAKQAPTRPAIPGSMAEKIVLTARSQIGTPYRWAGHSPQGGFDCSGLVFWVFARQNITLPRTTREQMRQGSRVPVDQLQAGDLVFFRIGAKTHHVGIATGQGSFVHSPKAGSRVREESLLLPYWQQRLIAIRRMI